MKTITNFLETIPALGSLGPRGKATKCLDDDRQAVKLRSRMRSADRRLLALSAAVMVSAVAAQAQAFQIGSVNSPLVLDVPAGSTQPGVQIQQWTANGGANQQWVFHHSPDNLGYFIFSVKSALVLDVPGWSNEPGTPIQQWIVDGGANQEWRIKAKGGSAFEIVSDSSGMVLDVPGFSTQPGAHIQQWPENGGANQLWAFTSRDTAAISVVGQRNQVGGYITITGKGFSPGSTLHVYYEGVPQVRGIVSVGEIVRVDANGTFSIVDLVYISSVNHSDAFGFVTVVVEDEEGNARAIGSVSAAYWVN